MILLEKYLRSTSNIRDTTKRFVNLLVIIHNCYLLFHDIIHYKKLLLHVAELIYKKKRTLNLIVWAFSMILEPDQIQFLIYKNVL